MRKFVSWLVVLSIFIFIIDWGILGLKIFNGDYEITLLAYIGLISIITSLISIIYLKSTNKCKCCGRIIPSYGRYCLYCGKEIK